MATRRARIQIKPNTGPRNVGREAGTDKTPSTPPKPLPQSPTKATPPPPPPSAPALLLQPQPSQPAPPPAQRIAKTTATDPTPLSPTKALTESSSKVAAEPPPPPPKAPLDIVPVEPQVLSLETKKNAEKTVSTVFKKPEVPNKNSQVAKENLLALVEVTDSSTTQPTNAKKSTTRKTKPRDECKSVQRKHLSAFKPTEPPDRTKMTIMDLIHWNPMQNPMKRSIEIVRATSTQSLEEASTSESPSQDIVEKQTEETENFVPGPRVIVGEDGQITIDESSLVIEQTASQNDLSQEVVYETSDTTYSSYSKKIISRQLWTMKETAMFYKALSVVGTDFALMAKFFPKRTRADLKRKFKKEERTRRDLLDKAVSEWHNFDLEDIQDFLFCKEPRNVDDQDEEESRVDNPDDPTLENLLLSRMDNPNDTIEPCDGPANHPSNGVLPKTKKRGRPPGQGNKSKNEKTTEMQGKKKSRKKNKRPAARNAWSDEEAEPVGSEDELLIICDDNDEQDKCEEHQNEECECCLIKTKTSKRQHSLEAKKRRLQELEQQRQKFIEASLRPVREVSPARSPAHLPDKVTFSVLTNKSMSTTPIRVVNASPVFQTPSTPSDASFPATPKSPTNLTPTLSSTNNVNATTPNTSNASAVMMNRNTTPVNKVIGVPLAGRTLLTPKPVNLVNLNNSGTASPLLQALLNRVPQNSPSGTPSKFLLVADKTENNEQVLHVYLVSPTQNSNASTSNGIQVNADSLQRLGIRPIIQQQQQPETQKPENLSEKKT